MAFKTNKAIKISQKHLLGIQDLSINDVNLILDEAHAFIKVNQSKNKKIDVLSGKTQINLFFEPSTRTQSSFELAGKRLGADVMSMNISNSAIKKGETLIDTAMTLNAMHPDIIVVRHQDSGACNLLSQKVNCAVLNAGDGRREHPTQALLDALTIINRKEKIEGLKIAICGDILHSRVARSNIYLLNMLGAEVNIIAPTNLMPKEIEKFGVNTFTDMKKGLKNCDIVMMLRLQNERMTSSYLSSNREYYEYYGLTPDKLEHAKPDALIMHPGPMNRGIEIDTILADDINKSVIKEQVELGVAVRMACLKMFCIYMKKQYFINANIIDPQNSINEVGGLIIGEDGKVEAIGKKVNTNNLPTREKHVDLKGKYIFPGLVDMRVFVGEPGYEYKENFRTLSNAALAGGVTSVVTMPNTDPIIDNVSIVDFLKRRGRDKSKINIFPCASLTKNIEGTNMTEFGLLQKKGIIAFTDGVKTIQNPRLMSRIMNSAKDLGCLIMQHAEDYELAKNGMINSGIIASKLGLSGIPEIAERILIERDLTLLEKVKCRYHISQLSSQKSIEVIKQRKEIIKFTSGVSINNLSLNENDIGDFKTFLKLSPPLRREEDRIALVQGLKDEIIDVIVSDHKPEDEESKRLTFSQAAAGASGIETLLSLSLELYHNGSLKLETIIKALTSNPAKILKINKGNLSIGNDADLCIVDIDKPWIVKKEKLVSKSKNTSIEDKKLQGKVINTFVKGKELFKL